MHEPQGSGRREPTGKPAPAQTDREPQQRPADAPKRRNRPLLRAGERTGQADEQEMPLPPWRR